VDEFPNDSRPSRIFKYELEPDRRQLIQMDRRASIIHVAEQYGRLVMWAQSYVDPISRQPYEVVPRVFVVVTTGDLFNANGKFYLGSATLGKQGEEWFVAHVFEQQQGHKDPVDDRVPEDWKQIKAELKSD
jgi:hypothetical protein